MESTGIYWVPLHEILVAHGIEVFLVNARNAKNVPGRKTDINDAQWLQQLHSYGLVGDFQESCHSLAAIQAAWIKGSARSGSCSSGGLFIHTSAG
ncbi:transposase [Synechococcus sp. CBW1108]|uniref:IS110 family transposase n=1 Tax=Synechococcus sp. CBW1108 TaxID=1353147 RepID=UPI0018CEF16A